jgi:hypothetical protein
VELANKGRVREEGVAGRLLTMAREMGGGPVRCGWGAEDGSARSACLRKEDEGGAGWLGRPKAEAQWRFGSGGPNEGKGEWAGRGVRRGGRGWAESGVGLEFKRNSFQILIDFRI